MIILCISHNKNKQRRHLNKSFKERLHSESGNIESALVMIPLISLFLIAIQLIATVNLRNVDMTKAQNQARIQATNNESDVNGNMVALKSGDLFSKLRLVIVNIERELPQIFPGVNHLVAGKKLKTSGVAVYEENEECSGGYLVC